MPGIEEYSIEKRAIAGSFGKAASSYDEYAQLQRRIADTLFSHLSPDDSKRRVLDLGSGTGYCSNRLRLFFPQADIVSLDISLSMLDYAKNKKKLNINQYVCADAEELPFSDHSFDLVFSSLAIQWCKSYSKLFSELRRVSTVGSSCYLSTFGPDTLQELREAWAKVDSYVHVNKFEESSSLHRKVQEQSFSGLRLNKEILTNYYDDLFALSTELKAIGAHNMNKGQARGLTGKTKLAALKKAFEADRVSHKGIPVSYQIYYLIIDV